MYYRLWKTKTKEGLMRLLRLRQAGFHSFVAAEVGSLRLLWREWEQQQWQQRPAVPLCAGLCGVCFSDWR
jgi:hypothetical protein